MGSRTHIPKYKTRIEQDGNKTRVVLYSTPIVVFDEEHIELNMGYWDTVTTRARMNQVSYVYGLGYGVFRKRGITYVRYNEHGKEVVEPLHNGFVIIRKERNTHV